MAVFTSVFAALVCMLALAGCMQVAVITELCEGGSLFHTLRHHGVCDWPW